ncbi:hypothetical protein [Streptomyces goshikiensis]|uniref:hypothetical protein n=1 Tax=Streptomyces goshikiensis TaxID=1942 RepID=UPI002E14D10C|nr:hypothetical protein OG224_34905 [Streptomyces goshikiensis]
MKTFRMPADPDELVDVIAVAVRAGDDSRIGLLLDRLKEVAGLSQSTRPAARLAGAQPDAQFRRILAERTNAAAATPRSQRPSMRGAGGGAGKRAIVNARRSVCAGAPDEGLGIGGQRDSERRG